MIAFAFDPPDLKEHIVSRTGCTPDDAAVLACLLTEGNMGGDLPEVLKSIHDDVALKYGRDVGVPSSLPGSATPIFMGYSFDETLIFVRYGVAPPRHLGNVIDRIRKAIADHPSGAPKKRSGRKPPKKKDLARDRNIWCARRNGDDYDAIAERLGISTREVALALDRHRKRESRKRE